MIVLISMTFKIIWLPLSWKGTNNSITETSFQYLYDRAQLHLLRTWLAVAWNMKNTQGKVRQTHARTHTHMCYRLRSHENSTDHFSTLLSIWQVATGYNTHTHTHTHNPAKSCRASYSQFPCSHFPRNVVHCVPQARLYAIRLTFSPRPGKPSGQIGARFPFAISCPFHALSPTLSQPRRKLKCCHSVSPAFRHGVVAPGGRVASFPTRVVGNAFHLLSRFSSAKGGCGGGWRGWGRMCCTPLCWRWSCLWVREKSGIFQT